MQKFRMRSRIDCGEPGILSCILVVSPCLNKKYVFKNSLLQERDIGLPQLLEDELC